MNVKIKTKHLERRARMPLLGLAAAAPLAIIGASMSPGSAQAAMPQCNVEALRRVAPAGLTIGDIPNMGGAHRTTNGVAYVPAANGNPEYCVMTGTFVTNPATRKTANFSAGLPAKGLWNGKYIQQGCGYNCGTVASPSVAALRKGYVTWATDDGHTAKPSPGPLLADSTDASWATSRPGQSNTDTVADFMYRAVHTLSVSGKAFTQGFYDVSRIRHAYFMGCSDGGREGMVEASVFPTDFDGIIAGAPYFDMSNEMFTTLVAVQAQLRNPRAALTLKHFEVLDVAVRENCDPTDGTADGLVQNPAACTFNPYKDLPQCKSGAAGENCFTKDQLDSVNIMYSAIRSPSGKVIYPGFSITDANTDFSYWVGFHAPPTNLTGPDPWSGNPALQPQGWYWANGTLRHMVYDDAPGYNSLKTPGIKFVNGANGMHAVIPDETVALITAKTRQGSGATPSAIGPYLAQGRKLIMYHGLSDGLITPHRTQQYYRALAARHGGYEELKKSAQLYMVPDMGHCGRGPGVTSFSASGPLDVIDAEHDILTALETWVEQGKQPTHLIASKFSAGAGPRIQAANATPTEVTLLRTMPLCPFPAMAKYSGAGDKNDAGNWSCPVGDSRMEQFALSGTGAGVDAPLSNE